ncbi:RNA polymerase sigma factor [Sphingobacterium kyonggiense]
MLTNTNEIGQDVQGLIQGDIRSFERIYRRYADPLFRYILKLTKNEEQALDIVQMTFIKIWNKRESVNIEKSFQAFIYHISNNLAIDYLRQVAKDQQKQSELWHYSEQMGLSVEEEFILKEKSELVNQLISQLPKQQEQVFRLCKLEGYSYAEAAEALQISPSTVSNHLTAAVKTIRELLDKNKDTLLFILFIIKGLL